MTGTAAPISSWFEVECVAARRALDEAYVEVDCEFAEQLSTAHTRSFGAATIDTRYGPEQLTRDIPNIGGEQLAQLDEHGLVRVGTQVGPGSILIGKVTPKRPEPVAAEEKLLLAIFGEAAGEVRDSSLRCPPGCAGRVESARLIESEAEAKGKAKGELARAEVVIAWDRPLVVGDELLIAGPREQVRVCVAGVSRFADGGELAWSGCTGSGSLRVAKVSMVEELIHARAIGPYSIVTQQPLRGRESKGGQTLYRQQAATLAGVAPWSSWEMFTVKSDSIAGRMRAFESLVRGVDLEQPGDGDGERPAAERAALLPESIEMLERELAALAIEVRFAAAELGARLLTSEELRARSHGEVEKPETINYRTHTPERGGLFCARVFGPTEDFRCICGKYSKVSQRGVRCEKCGVEVTHSRVRRERFGHVELAVAVVHPLLRAPVARLLGLSSTQLDELLVGAAGFDESGKLRSASLEDVDAIETGGWALRRALEAVDLQQLRESTDLDQRELARVLAARGIPPTQLLLEVLPILPPDLRPLVPLDDGKFASSDLNDLYRRVVNRNNRLRRLIELDAPALILRNEFGQLQGAVDQLFDNERCAKPLSFKGRPLRSLGSITQARFSYVLERCVDYSGVTRFVADPTLSRTRCRLPRRMATELFKPMAYARMESKGQVTTIKAAKAAVEQGLDSGRVAIAEASAARPVLLLSEAGLAAREVELWDEAAIAVDPGTARLLAGRERASSVCVHLPLSEAACEELAGLEDAEIRAGEHETQGWFSAAVFEGEGLARVVEALLDGREQEIDDPLLAAALGRGPNYVPGQRAGAQAFPAEEDEDDF